MDNAQLRPSPALGTFSAQICALRRVPCCDAIHTLCTVSEPSPARPDRVTPTSQLRGRTNLPLGALTTARVLGRDGVPAVAVFSAGGPAVAGAVLGAVLGAVVPGIRRGPECNKAIISVCSKVGTRAAAATHFGFLPTAAARLFWRAFRAIAIIACRVYTASFPALCRNQLSMPSCPGCSPATRG